MLTKSTVITSGRLRPKVTTTTITNQRSYH